MVVTASVIAPFLALGAVAYAGKLGYFRDLTFGETLPVAFHWMPFAVAAGTGLLGLAMFVLPAVIGVLPKILSGCRSIGSRRIDILGASVKRPVDIRRPVL